MDANDKLYACGKKFLAEVGVVIEDMVDKIRNHIKGIEQVDESSRERAGRLALDTMARLTDLVDLGQQKTAEVGVEGTWFWDTDIHTHTHTHTHTLRSLRAPATTNAFACLRRQQLCVSLFDIARAAQYDVKARSAVLKHIDALVALERPGAAELRARLK